MNVEHPLQGLGFAAPLLLALATRVMPAAVAVGGTAVLAATVALLMRRDTPSHAGETAELQHVPRARVPSRTRTLD